jgi:hypothetical protein
MKRAASASGVLVEQALLLLGNAFRTCVNL